MRKYADISTAIEDFSGVDTWKRSVLFKALNDEDFENMTANNFRKPIRESKNRGLVVEFACFLYGKREISDPLLERVSLTLPWFKMNAAPADLYDLVIDANDFDEYSKENGFLTLAGRKNFYFSHLGVDDIEYLSKDVKTACTSIIRKIGKDTSVSFPLRTENMMRIRDMAGLFFNGIDNSVSYQTVISILEKEDDEGYPVKLTKTLTRRFSATLFEILTELHKSSALTDERVKAMVEKLYPALTADLRDAKNPIRLDEEFVDLLNDPFIRQYEVIKPVKYSNRLLLRIGTDKPELRSAITDYIAKAGNGNPKYKIFAAEFSESLEADEPEIAEDLTLDDYITQFRYYSRYNSEMAESVTSVLTTFYLWVWQEMNPDLFSESSVSPDILRNPRLTELLEAGFRIISYGMGGPIPDEDKWLLVMAGKAEVNSDEKRDYLVLDFTQIDYPLYRTWMKKYIWLHSASMTGKTSNWNWIVDFLNFLNDLKTGNYTGVFDNQGREHVSVVYVFNTDVMDEFTAEEAVAYRNRVESGRSRKQAKRVLDRVKVFLNFLKDERLCRIPWNTKDLLYLGNVSVESNSAPLTKEDVDKLGDIMEKTKEDSYRNSMCYIVAMLQKFTKYRMDDILSLNTNCLVQAAKPGDYNIRLRRKNTHKLFYVEPITKTVAGLLKDALKLTEHVRDKCQDARKAGKLFLIMSKNRSVPTPVLLSRDNYRKYLAEMSGMARIPRVLPQNLRDTYLNNVDDYALKNNLTPAEKNALTGHSSSVTDEKSYIYNNSVNQMIELGGQVIIGQVDTERYPMKGTVKKFLDPDAFNKKNLVNNGTGFCGNGKGCVSVAFADCVMCDKFVTDLSHRQEFITAVEDFKREAKKDGLTGHEIKDLNLLITLYSMYLNRMDALEREMKEGVLADGTGN